MLTELFALPHKAILHCALLAAFVLIASPCARGEQYTEDGVIALKNAVPKPDFSRLPSFYTSDSAYDAFVNEYFMRHLSVDDTGVYWYHPVVGAVDNMWTVEWDAWFLPWIDRGAMGLERQLGDTSDVILTTILKAAVDKYGYAWFANARPEGNSGLPGGYYPTFCWPWPKYYRNTTVTRPTGWEFNGTTDDFRKEIIARDVDLEPEYVDSRLAGRVTGPHPEILTPKFDVDVFHVPIVEIDIEYRTPNGQSADKLIDGLKIYWTTADSPRFSESRMVTIDFCDLPPKDDPKYYTSWVGASSARYSLFFPMYLHPDWGRTGRRITRLKVVPCASEGKGAEIHLNYIRASYDVRSSVTNTEQINSVYRLFMWSGDEDLLTAEMPKLRRAILFLNHHLRGKTDRLLNFSWMAGHDGLGGDNVGHGLIGSYWDLLPAGHHDLESSADYYYALRAMAALERAVNRRKVAVPPVTVIGPDNRTVIPYRETAKSLDALADKVKARMRKAFWVAETGRFCRNIDVTGKKHDYGFLHANLQALMFGIGTKAQRDSVLSWLDGRVVSGDTSTGADIYRWRFAPRTTTKRNQDYYFWPWVQDSRVPPESESAKYHKWGDQMQDGGAVPFTSLFEMMVRCRTRRQDQIDRAFERTLEIKKWYEDVKAAGGKGTEFYRAYYAGHPERGVQQGGGPPGGLGLDREFLSDASLGTLFLLYAFLGVDATEDGVISVAPAIPTRLDKIGVRNVYYRGNYLTIEAGGDYVSFQGSKITGAAGLKARVTFPRPPGGFEILVDGKRAGRYTKGPDGEVTVVTDLQPVRIELRRKG
ncbi:MAG: hypothetical protein Q7T82_12375 [Armatimonadota bacterium]|nr:hypothetical protein [Armatimonadota bacterium]